jgi:hypothetical protein
VDEEAVSKTANGSSILSQDAFFEPSSASRLTAFLFSLEGNSSDKTKQLPEGEGNEQETDLHAVTGGEPHH